jgi:hypothetical protein
MVTSNLMCLEKFSSLDFDVTGHLSHIMRHPNLKPQLLILETVFPDLRNVAAAPC